MSSQRLQKILAQAGIASRRAAERLITEGRVRVNGRIVRELGSRANPPRDRVEVDGKRLVAARMGIAVHDRTPGLRPNAFGEAAVARLAARLGPYQA